MKGVRTNLPLDDIRRRLAAGETMKAIGAVYGCNKNTIGHLARYHDLPRSKRGPRRILPTVEVLMDLVSKDMSLKSIGDRFGVSPAAVGDAITRAGWRRVSHGGREFERTAS